MLCLALAPHSNMELSWNPMATWILSVQSLNVLPMSAWAFFRIPLSAQSYVN